MKRFFILPVAMFCILLLFPTLALASSHSGQGSWRRWDTHKGYETVTWLYNGALRSNDVDVYTPVLRNGSRSNYLTLYAFGSAIRAIGYREVASQLKVWWSDGKPYVDKVDIITSAKYYKKSVTIIGATRGTTSIGDEKFKIKFSDGSTTWVQARKGTSCGFLNCYNTDALAVAVAKGKRPKATFEYLSWTSGLKKAFTITGFWV